MIDRIKKTAYIFCIFLFISSYCFSQNKFRLLTTIDIESDFITTDNQGNIYATKGDELTKYDKTGKRLYKYSNKRLGNITFVDASNMLKLLVFYKDFLQVVFLDNTLSVNGETISLDKIGFQQAQLVCSSHNNGMWLYNQQNFELLRLNQNLEKQQQTGNLTAILHTELQPNFLMEYNNKVYLNNPSGGVLVFDIYGTYFKTIPENNLNYFQPIGDQVFFVFDKKIKAYNLKTSEEQQFEMPISGFKKFRLEMNLLVLQTNTSILVYSSE